MTPEEHAVEIPKRIWQFVGSKERWEGFNPQ